MSEAPFSNSSFIIALPLANCNTKVFLFSEKFPSNGIPVYGIASPLVATYVYKVQAFIPLKGKCVIKLVVEYYRRIIDLSAMMEMLEEKIAVIY